MIITLGGLILAKDCQELAWVIQGQLQEWTEHSHTDLPKSETSRDIKKSF
jgi:hypothetical protein